MLKNHCINSEPYNRNYEWVTFDQDHNMGRCVYLENSWYSVQHPTTKSKDPQIGGLMQNRII